MLACFALSPTARAVDPPPDGGYPNANTAEGEDALFSLTSGSDNTAVGFNALFSNTTGFGNTAIGFEALLSNTTGTYNTATGWQALHSNTTGGSNTAYGVNALANNTTGTSNTAYGGTALANNTTGIANNANGGGALFNNTTGSFNSANGVNALFNNTTGNFNTANGYQALINNTIGSFNTAIGFNALGRCKRGDNNIAIGRDAGRAFNSIENHNIDIGNVGVTGESDTIRIGTSGSQTNAYIAGISGVTVAGGIGVIVDSSGHLGTTTSSARFKDQIKPMDRASEAILALKPVTFHYKQELDPEGIPQFGLVAEEVEKVNPDLVARDEQGKPYSVRYDAVNAMLLNEFLKEHRTVQQQGATIEGLEAQIAHQRREFQTTISQLQSALKEQAMQIQKVSAQVELSKPAPRTVLNNQ